MAVTHYLVTGTSAEEIERLTGLAAHDTPLGTLVEKPKPFRLDVELEKLDRILHPIRCRCVGVLHRPDCPMAFAVT